MKIKRQKPRSPDPPKADGTRMSENVVLRLYVIEINPLKYCPLPIHHINPSMIFP